MRKEMEEKLEKMDVEIDNLKKTVAVYSVELCPLISF